MLNVYLCGTCIGRSKECDFGVVADMVNTANEHIKKKEYYLALLDLKDTRVLRFHSDNSRYMGRQHFFGQFAKQ